MLMIVNAALRALGLHKYRYLGVLVSHIIGSHDTRPVYMRA
jgi:hypothetical protein